MRYRTTLVGTDHRARLAGMVLVNGLLALILTALYFAALWSLSWLLGGPQTQMTHILATIVVAVSVVPLRARLLSLANYLLKREWQASQELVRDVGDLLSRAIEPDSLRALLIDDLPGRLRLTGAMLWMLEPPDDYAYTAVGEPRDQPGALLLANGTVVRLVSLAAQRPGYLDIPTTNEADWATPFAERGLVMLLSLRVGERLVGIYGCGPATNSRPISSHVLGLLITLSPAIASAIENTRAYATIERLNEQLRALDQLKGEFIESVGHELRTPLTTLNLSTDLLLAQNEMPPPLMRTMRTSLRQLHTLVNQVLAFEERNWRQDDQQATASVLIDLETFVPELLVSYEAVAYAKGLRFEIAVEPGLAVWGVPSRLLRALREVLDNAVRYTPRGLVQIGAVYRDGLAVVQIADEGPGIPPEERDHLFIAFYRGRSVRALADTPGAGLGLSIAQRELAALGGQIWLERSNEDGTVIGISLPAMMVLDSSDGLERTVGE